MPYAERDPMLTAHNVAAEQYRRDIEVVALARNLPQALIVAIGSRESGWGTLLRPPGPAGKGDMGHGRGLMQIDDRNHEFARSGRWQDPTCNIDYGAAYLCRLIDANRIPSLALSATTILRRALAAYNCEQGNVNRALARRKDIDHFTSGRDYSADVLARAIWFAAHGWPTTEPIIEA